MGPVSVGLRWVGGGGAHGGKRGKPGGDGGKGGKRCGDGSKGGKRCGDGKRGKPGGDGGKCCIRQGLSPVLMPLPGLAPVSPFFGLRPVGRLSLSK